VFTTVSGENQLISRVHELRVISGFEKRDGSFFYDFTSDGVGPAMVIFTYRFECIFVNLLEVSCETGYRED
jgi:hypothetical protein